MVFVLVLLPHTVFAFHIQQMEVNKFQIPSTYKRNVLLKLFINI